MEGNRVPEIRGVGIDLVEVGRFERFGTDRQHPFLQKVFSDGELDYCFEHKNPAQRLAGIFAAKEASSKALGVAEFPFIALEIRHKEGGAPEVWKDGVKLPVKVSITDTNSMAAAVALA